jgi:uncharacterized protein YqjF (DUF2071 family)
LPAVPTAAVFDEVNVRTYVHRDGAEPGVWFFSLDAGSALAVLGARAFFHLPYFHARFEVTETERGGRYRSERHWASDEEASVDVSYESGNDLGPAREATLEHFLVERYSLYTLRGRGELLQARVHHRPYPLRAARTTTLRESLIAAAGIAPPGGPLASELWSEGVDVEIFGLTRAPASA